MIHEDIQVHEEIVILEEIRKHKNEEKSTIYIYTNKMWDLNEINIDNIFFIHNNY